MDSIPLEILSEVFSQLPLQDWLECIQVCRSWRSIVPMAVSHLSICLDSRSWRFIRQIHHFNMIHSATFRSFPAKHLCAALDGLSACRITQLAIDHVLFKSMDVIVGQQHLWTSQLESLSLIEPLDNELEFDLFDDIIATCPRLAHFCYTNHPRSKRLKVSASSAIASRTNLESLSLSTYLEYSQVVCILQSSPGLQTLKLSFAQPMDPQMIISFCPSLTSLHLGSFNWLPDFQLNSIPRSRGLRYLCLSSTSHSTTAFLLEHAATLQVLHLPASIPVSFRSRQLRILSCDASQDQNGILDSLLEGLDGIHELSLHHVAPTRSLSRAIQQLAPTLTTLKITVQFAWKEDDNNNSQVFLEMLAFLPNLVTLSYQCRAINASKLRNLAKAKSLQALTIKSIEYAPLVALTCLADLRALRTLELWRMAYFSVEPLVHLEYLESIRLQWCVGPVGIRSLAEKAPRNLKRIGLQNCRAVPYEDIPEHLLAQRGISIDVQ